MRNLLMLTFYFPPEASSAVHRALGFVRSLPALGWRPLVLTLRQDRYEPFCPIDEKLLDRVPSTAIVFRTGILRVLPFLLRLGRRKRRAPEASFGQRAGSPRFGIAQRMNLFQRFKSALVGLFSTPDRQVGWVPMACWRAMWVARRYSIAAIFTTGRPWTAHLLGLALRSLLGKPWVADFRDPWTQNPWMPYQSRLRKRWELFLESRVVHAADRVVANTAALREDFIHRFPDLPSHKFVAITNGYEPDSERALFLSSVVNSPVLTLTHAGALYYRRDPRNFILAVGKLIQEGKILAQEIHLNFVGENLIPGLQNGQFIKSHGLGEVVTFFGRLPHQKCLEIQEASHALILIQPGTRLQVPAKLYEYLMMGKPILALTSDGATSDQMRSEGLGSVADINEPVQIQTAVLELYRRFKEGRLATDYEHQTRAKFRFDHLTRRLVYLLEEIAGPK